MNAAPGNDGLTSVSAIHIPGIYSQEPGIWPHVFGNNPRNLGVYFDEKIPELDKTIWEKSSLFSRGYNQKKFF